MDPLVAALLRSALALLFLVAASHKARDLGGFRATLADYHLLPEGASAFAAPLVAASEIAVAAALALPGLRLPAPLSAAGLLAVYTAAIAINLARGRRHIDCGCAGPIRRQPLSGWLIARNVALMAAALVCLLPPRPRPLVWIDALTLLGGVTGLAALYAAVDRLIANTQHRVRLEGV